MPEYAERLDKFIANDRLVRKVWGDGHDRACLLGAMAPRCSEGKDADLCPAEVCPSWWADLTVYMDDSGSGGEIWKEMIQRYARLAHRWHVLAPADWTSLYYRCVAYILSQEQEVQETDKIVWYTSAIQDILALAAGAARPNPDSWQRFTSSPYTKVYDSLYCSVVDDGKVESVWFSVASGLSTVAGYGNRPLEPQQIRDFWDKATQHILTSLEKLCADVEARDLPKE